MSTTTMNSSNSLTVKRWEMETWLQAYRYSGLGLLMDAGAIYVPEELKGQRTGDQVTFAYAGKLTGVPLGEGGTLDGNEEALDLNSHSMVMNVSRIGVLNPNKNTIEQQRTNVNFSEVARKQLARRTIELVDTSMFQQLAGAAPSSLTIDGTTYSSSTTLLQVTGHNSIVAPTSERVVRAGGAVNDESLTSSNKFTLDLIDAALERATAGGTSSQPLQMFDDNTFICIVSPEQGVDLLRDSAGKVTLYANHLADKIAGKKTPLDDMNLGTAKGMIYLGRYRNVDIYQAPRVAYGVNSSNSAVITSVRRAVLVGMDAASFASPFGSTLSDSDVPVKFFSQYKDYDYFMGMEARLIYGLKKMSPSNKQDIGTVVISTYAAAHTA